ncbi:MAG: hypothetical protein JKY25_02835 [Robiginitomaculum sp.]|nr:hypothetical protein [Robiginitomaculum sp.]
MYTAERHFVTTAQEHLRQLMNSGCDAPTALHGIKQKAMPLKARAIYRAALLCEDVLARSGTHSDTKFQTSLARLNKLLGLYENGLFEIDPEFKALQSGQAASPVTSPASGPVSGPASRKIIELLDAANENAAQILTPLLRLVREDGQKSAQKSALKFLTQYDGSHSSVLQDTSENRTPEIRFETMMGRITNRVLSEARLNAKGISISYAADFDSVDVSLAKPLQALLEQICLGIVRVGLVDEPGANNDPKRVWQISVTGKGQGHTNLISVSWPGYALARKEHTGLVEAIARFQALGGQTNHKARKGADRDALHGIDTGLDIQSLEITSPLKIPGKSQISHNANKADKPVNRENTNKGQAVSFAPAVNM